MPATSDTSAAIANAYQPIANPAGGYASAMKVTSSWAIGARQTLGVQRIGITGVGDVAADIAASVAGLARTLAGQGRRILIIDADPSSAVLQVVLGVPQGPGLAELLVGRAPFENVIARDTASPAQLLPPPSACDKRGLDHTTRQFNPSTLERRGTAGYSSGLGSPRAGRAGISHGDPPFFRGAKTLRKCRRRGFCFTTSINPKPHGNNGFLAAGVAPG